MYCRICGKETTDGAVFCKDCGAGRLEPSSQPISNDTNPHISVNQAPNEKVSYNTMCVLGFTLSGISLIFDFQGLLSIAGIVLSVLGLINYKRKNEKGKTFAIFGIIIGVASLIITAIIIKANIENYFELISNMMENVESLQ